MKTINFFLMLQLCAVCLCFTACNDDAVVEKSTRMKSETLEFLEFDTEAGIEYNTAVFEKIEHRLLEHVRYENGSYSLEHTSAQQLGIEEKAYSFYKGYVLWALNNDKYKSKALTRVMSDE